MVAIPCDVRVLEGICALRRERELNYWRDLIRNDLKNFNITYADISLSTHISIDRLKSVMTRAYPRDYEAVAINRVLSAYRIIKHGKLSACVPGDDKIIPGETKLLNKDLREKL